MQRIGAILLSLLWLAWPQTGIGALGNWSANGFTYKPSLGVRLSLEQKDFKSGLERVDARLGKEIWTGDPNYGPTLQEAVTAIGSNNVILRVPVGAYNIADDLTIPDNITIKLERGAILTIANGKTLAFNGGLEAELFQIFTWTGTGEVVFGAGSIKEIYPQWWGAKGDGVTDNTAAIQAAINAVPAKGALVFPSGTYLTGRLRLKSHIKLLGRGGVLQAAGNNAVLSNWDPATYDKTTRADSQGAIDCVFATLDGLHLTSSYAAPVMDFMSLRYSRILNITCENTKWPVRLRSRCSNNYFAGNMFNYGGTDGGTDSVAFWLGGELNEYATSDPFPFANSCTFVGNTVMQFSKGLKLVYGYGNRFYGNHFENYQTGPGAVGLEAGKGYMELYYSSSLTQNYFQANYFELGNNAGISNYIFYLNDTSLTDVIRADFQDNLLSAWDQPNSGIQSATMLVSNVPGNGGKMAAFDVDAFLGRRLVGIQQLEPINKNFDFFSWKAGDNVIPDGWSNFALATYQRLTSGLYLGNNGVRVTASINGGDMVHYLDPLAGTLNQKAMSIAAIARVPLSNAHNAYLRIDYGGPVVERRIPKTGDWVVIGERGIVGVKSTPTKLRVGVKVDQAGDYVDVNLLCINLGDIPHLTLPRSLSTVEPLVGGKRQTSGTVAPTTGTWGAGDICWNSNPSAGGTPGWVCVAAGAPGAWKAMANLEN